MTRKEAIQKIEYIRDGNDFKPTDAQVKALDMAIEALQAPTKSTNTPTDTPTDLISRQAVIELVKGSYYDLAGSMDDVWSMVAEVESLPSADRPTGEWNRLSHDTFHCNLCGRTFIVIQGEDAMNYCPNCGKKMVREDGEEE